MMNKLVILLLSACCLLMTACDKENDETAQGFRIMKADVDLVAGGGTVEVALQTTGELTGRHGDFRFYSLSTQVRNHLLLKQPALPASRFPAARSL